MKVHPPKNGVQDGSDDVTSPEHHLNMFYTLNAVYQDGDGNVFTPWMMKAMDRLLSDPNADIEVCALVAKMRDYMQEIHQ